MEPIVLLIIGLIVFVIILRIVFKIAGWIIKLLLLAAVCLAIYWVVTRM
jgi:hypothetical protein